MESGKVSFVLALSYPIPYRKPSFMFFFSYLLKYNAKEQNVLSR